MRHFGIAIFALAALAASAAFIYWPRSVIASEDYEGFQSIIKLRFVDPSSIQFDKLRAGASPHTYCGEINAKNLYGGYVGFLPFVADVRAKFLYLMDPKAVNDLMPDNVEDLIRNKEEIDRKAAEIQRQLDRFTMECRRVN